MEASGNWAERAFPDLYNQAPAKMTNLFPSCKFEADILIEIPGAELPNGFELFLYVENSQGLRGGSTFWGRAVFLSDNCCGDAKATALVFCFRKQEASTAADSSCRLISQSAEAQQKG